MHKSITLKAPAKINLILDIVGKRDDGYHNLRSVMQAISIFDYVTLTVSESRTNADFPNIKIKCDKPNIPTDKRNIVYKALNAFFKASGKTDFGDIEIDIKKNIPSGAGLAGGSADGAAVLVGLNKISGEIFSLKKLCEIGASIGADVPFCIVGGTTLCEGIGEKLTPLTPLPDCKILVVKPDISISTPLSYKKFDELKKPKLSDFDAFMQALKIGELPEISNKLSNSLEEATGESIIEEIKNTIIHSGALGSIMTGSGSAVFGIFDNVGDAEQCAEKFYNSQKFCQICSPVKYGAQII